ncbi:hypothetical protein PIB30_099729, partial [Stylosanthes scabra]|nr:hypothetical protein [Stylosanthes scabra]
MLATLTQDTISSQGCQLLRHFEFGTENSVRSQSKKTNELSRKVHRVSSQDMNTQRQTGLPPIPVAIAGMSEVPTASCEVAGQRVGARNYRMHFRPRADMGLDVEATRLAVYIYAFIGDLREILVRHDNHDLTRVDLLSLRPRLTPSDVVFVPIWDVDEAWYMMILDVRKPRVYSLDVHRTVENMVRKEKQIKAVVSLYNFSIASCSVAFLGEILWH